MSERSIEDVLADLLIEDGRGRYVVRAAFDALAAADLPLVDRERGIAVIRLDPEEAEWMHKAIDALALQVPAAVHRDFAPRFHAVARIIGGESE